MWKKIKDPFVGLFYGKYFRPSWIEQTVSKNATFIFLMTMFLIAYILLRKHANKKVEKEKTSNT